MSDFEEISQLIARVGHLVDHQAWDRLEEVFTPDAVFVQATGVAHEGLDAIRSFMLAFEHPIAHYTTNIVVDVDPDGARATSCSKCLNPNSQGQLVIAEYDDALVRTDVGWRLQVRRAIIRARWPVTPDGAT